MIVVYQTSNANIVQLVLYINEYNNYNSANFGMQSEQNLKHNQENNEGPCMKICHVHVTVHIVPFSLLPTLPMLREYKPKQIPE